MQHTVGSGGKGPSEGQALLELLGKVRQGDRGAMAELYDRTSPLVFGLALGITGDRARAEEALLDTYTHIWKNAAACDPAVPPLDWLVATVRDRALLGRRRAKPSADASWLRPGAPRREPGGETGATADPGEQERARAAVADLPDAQREILVRAYGGTPSCDEIAARTGKPAGAVKTLVRLGMNRLAEAAEEDEVEARSRD